MNHKSYFAQYFLLDSSKEICLRSHSLSQLPSPPAVTTCASSYVILSSEQTFTAFDSSYDAVWVCMTRKWLDQHLLSRNEQLLTLSIKLLLQYIRSLHMLCWPSYSRVSYSPSFSNMSTRVIYHGPRRKLVLAFDVGTTYSGISYW